MAHADDQARDVRLSQYAEGQYVRDAGGKWWKVYHVTRDAMGRLYLVLDGAAAHAALREPDVVASSDRKPSGFSSTSRMRRGHFGPLVRLDNVRDETGKVRVGLWDRAATFGNKPKDGVEVDFSVDTFGQMIDGWLKRGERLSLCYNHQSAYTEQNGEPAPALAYYDAVAVVKDGAVARFEKLHVSQASAPDAAALKAAVAVLATDENPDPSPDGMWWFRCEVTEPIGQLLLPTFKYLSPMFVADGQNEFGEPLGYTIYDLAATNTAFQAGCILCFDRSGRPLVRMDHANGDHADRAREVRMARFKKGDRVVTRDGRIGVVIDSFPSPNAPGGDSVTIETERGTLTLPEREVEKDPAAMNRHSVQVAFNRADWPEGTKVERTNHRGERQTGVVIGWKGSEVQIRWHDLGVAAGFTENEIAQNGIRKMSVAMGALAVCPECGKQVQVVNGRYGQHDVGEPGSGTCPESGRPVVGRRGYSRDVQMALSLDDLGGAVGREAEIRGAGGIDTHVKIVGVEGDGTVEVEELQHGGHRLWVRPADFVRLLGTTMGGLPALSDEQQAVYEEWLRSSGRSHDTDRNLAYWITEVQTRWPELAKGQRRSFALAAAPPVTCACGHRFDLHAESDSRPCAMAECSCTAFASPASTMAVARGSLREGDRIEYKDRSGTTRRGYILTPPDAGADVGAIWVVRDDDPDKGDTIGWADVLRKLSLMSGTVMRGPDAGPCPKCGSSDTEIVDASGGTEKKCRACGNRWEPRALARTMAGSAKTVSKKVSELKAGDVMLVGSYFDRRTVAGPPEWNKGMYTIRFTDGSAISHNGYAEVTVEAVGMSVMARTNGYVYRLEGAGDWRSAPDDDWETISATVDGQVVGRRRVDGAEVVVIEQGGKFYAALPQNVSMQRMARDEHGRPYPPCPKCGSKDGIDESPSQRGLYECERCSWSGPASGINGFSRGGVTATSRSNGGTTMAKKFDEEMAKRFGLDEGADAGAIKQAYAKRMDEARGLLSEEEDGKKLLDAAKRLEEEASAYEAAFGDDDDAEKPHAAMRRLAAKMKRMAGGPAEAEPAAAAQPGAMADEGGFVDRMKAEGVPEDEAKQMARMAQRFGLDPRRATRRTVLAAAAAGSVPAERVESMVKQKLDEALALERQKRERQERSDKATKLFEAAVAGGYPADMRDEFVTFATSNYEAAQKVFKSYVQQGNQLFERVTRSGAPAGGARGGTGTSPTVIRQHGAVRVVKYACDFAAEAKKLAREKGLKYEAALDQVQREKPELYEAYLASLS